MKNPTTAMALLVAAAVLAGCSPDQTSAQVAAPHVHLEPGRRGSTAPAAPVQLTYRVPALTANQPATIAVTIDTRLDHGLLRLDIAGHEGVSMLGDTRYQFDLARMHERPLELPLRVLPIEADERFLAVLITVETEMGAMVRSFRIDLIPSAQIPVEGAQQKRSVLHR